MFDDILESSWSYQEMIQKGIDQGELKTLHSVLVRLVEKRFPALLPLAQQQTAQLNNLIVLNTAVDKLLSAQTAEQARQILTDIKASANSPS
jgi:hypothetical protein